MKTTLNSLGGQIDILRNREDQSPVQITVNAGHITIQSNGNEFRITPKYRGIIISTDKPIRVMPIEPTKISVTTQ